MLVLIFHHADFPICCVSSYLYGVAMVSSFIVPLAEQVFGDEEWSFGFCEQGSGVFSCPATKNPMYTFRETIKLGKTSFSIFKVNQILRELSREWPGHSYDLLSKNCNHFCDEFCERLGVPKLPGNYCFCMCLWFLLWYFQFAWGKFIFVSM